MTTYGPKFPEIKLTTNQSRITRVNPVDDYERLIAMRNAKVSIGAKLNYQIESERRIIKPKRS